MSTIGEAILVIGAGGHAKVVIDVVRASGWRPVACLDAGRVGGTCNGVAVTGRDDDAESFLANGVTCAVVALGSNQLRSRIGAQLVTLGFKCPALIHPSAVVSQTAEIGDGVVVMPQAAINAQAHIGAFSIINTGAIVEHDCRLGMGVHAAPRSVLGGSVRAGNLTFFGIGSVVLPQSILGARAMIGAGAVVIGPVPDDAVVVGVPARPLKNSTP